jgi:hypothetical protein
MKLLDPTKTRVRVEQTEHGNVVKHLDHFNGSTDAKVELKPIRIKLTLTDGAPLNAEHIEAIGGLQEAQRQWLVAKHSGQDEWKMYARTQLDHAERRVRETQ